MYMTERSRPLPLQRKIISCDVFFCIVSVNGYNYVYTKYLEVMFCCGNVDINGSFLTIKNELEEYFLCLKITRYKYTLLCLCIYTP